MTRNNTESCVDEMEIELPLVNLSPTDVYGALFVHTSNQKELYRDALMKLQTWIMNYAEAVVKPLRDSGAFSEEYVEGIKKKSCVISPLTLTLYLHWLQMEQFCKKPDSEKERYFLQKIPDRFKSRYKGNAACRNAREVSPDEETAEKDDIGRAENFELKRKMTFVEFLKEFGEVVKQGMSNLDKK